MKIRIGEIALAVAVFAMLLPATSTWSRNFRPERISEESYARLSEEARAEYENAYRLADRILYDPALDAAERAVDLQPTSIELRFFAMRLASFLAEINLEVDAVRYLERASSQCEAILDMEGIPPTLRDRVRYELNKFLDRAENIYRRDELRKTWGAKIAEEHVRSVFRKDFEEDRDERMQETLRALRDPDTRRSLAAQAAAQVLAGPEEEAEATPEPEN